MIADSTAASLVRDLVAYRELLSVTLALLADAQRQLEARDRIVIALRQDIGRLMQVQG